MEHFAKRFQNSKPKRVAFSLTRGLQGPKSGVENYVQIQKKLPDDPILYTHGAHGGLQIEISARVSWGGGGVGKIEVRVGSGNRSGRVMRGEGSAARTYRIEKVDGVDENCFLAASCSSSS